MKQKLQTRLAALLCVLTLLLSLASTARAAAEPAKSNNALRHDYSMQNTTVNSYLYANSSGGLTRVEWINYEEKLIVEDYSSAFQLQNSRTIPKEMERFGGFYAGQSYNFLIWGQPNRSESDSVEVVRVVKYDKNWTRLGQASVYGANTYYPFDAGSLRCTELGGSLYIHTCHEMYDNGDGKHHQANMNIVVRENDMSVTRVDCTISRYPGYVSHSFNQYILADQSGYIVTADHGDGYPRAMAVQKTSADGTNIGRAKTPDFKGNIGDNQTWASLGGLVETSSGYIIAYAQREYMTVPDRIKLAYVGKNSFSTSAEASFQIKDLTNGDNWEEQEQAPMLVPTSLSGGLILWNHITDSSTVFSLEKTSLCYASYSADGSVGAVQTVAGIPLSDCQPIYWNGKTVWYATNESAPVFYTLDSSGVKSIPANGSATATTSTVQTAFSDVPASHWAYSDIQALVDKGAVNGYSDKTFKPGNTISYVEFAAMTARALNPDYAKYHPQSSNEAWYMPYLKTVASDAAFDGTAMEDPAKWTQVMNQPITRAEMAAILAQMFCVGDGGFFVSCEEASRRISDWNSIREELKEAVAQAHGMGVLTGYSDGGIRPNATATRAEACVIVNRMARRWDGERLPAAWDDIV